MKKMNGKFISKVTVILLVLAMMQSLVACGSKAPENTADSSQAASISDNTAVPAIDDVKLDGVTLKFWKPLYWVGKVASDNENIAWQEVQKRLGVKLEFIQPTAGQEVDQFNLMIASDSLPDIISSSWGGDDMYTGGLDKYVKDEILIKLNDLVPQYAPDYLNTINTMVKEEEKKEFYTDSGNMVEFYAISPYEAYSYNGLQYRQDYMDKLGLKNPQTLTEVEAALKGFKDTLGVKSPLILANNGIDGLGGAFVSAFGIGPTFYQKDGKVMYGPIQPEFKDYLALMNDWYKKGLIDLDFASRDEDGWKRMLTSGESGAIVHSPDTVGAWMSGITTMMGGYNPAKNAGDKIQFRLKTYQCVPQYAVAVTSACKNPEAAVKFLNYGYTKEGYMLYNYGIEGQTYNLEGDKVVYTDMMMNNPDYPVLDAILKYKLHIGPFLRFEHEGNPAINQSTMAIRKFWTENSGTDLVLPMITLNAEEGTEYARIMNQVNTYLSTGIVKFIMGADSLDNFGKFVDDLKKLEVEKVITMEQAALERYNKR